MRRFALVALVFALVAGCASAPPVPSECRVRRPYIGPGVPFSIHVEVERAAAMAEEQCMRKKGL